MVDAQVANASYSGCRVIHLCISLSHPVVPEFVQSNIVEHCTAQQSAHSCHCWDENKAKEGHTRHKELAQQGTRQMRSTARSSSSQVKFHPSFALIIKFSGPWGS